MPDDASYARLPLNPSRYDGLEPLDVEDEDAHAEKPKAAGGLSESACWRLFVASCVVSLALSAVNLSALSAWTTIKTFSASFAQPTALEPKRPNPYLGLDRVVADPSSCRSRATFPKTFYTYDARDGPRAKLTRVHAPGDIVTLTFGGPIRAIADVYIPDHGLENCTLNLRRFKETGANAVQPVVDVEVYLRATADPTDGRASTFLDSLIFAPGKESISSPFYCPSRSHVFLEWRCPAEDCRVELPLEGVTSMTESGASLSKTGFRITQYEALHCIGV